MIVKYIAGNSGKEFILNQGYEINIKECDPYSVVWNYSGRSVQFGTVIERFEKDPIALNVTLKFRGSLSGIETNLEEFFEECEKDIISMSEGSLYVGEWRLTGYFTERSPAPSEEFYGQENTCVFLAPYPFWISQKTISFKPQIQEEEPGINSPVITGDIYTGQPLDNKAAIREFKFDFLRRSNRKVKYPLFDLPFDFVRTYGRMVVDNPAFTASNFVMTIYGYVNDPSVIIGGHTYSVEATVYDGERLVIDSKKGTVIKIGRFGEETNLYNSRNKVQSVFEKIPAGVTPFNWSGGFGIDITLIDERSVPKWDLSSVT